MAREYPLGRMVSSPCKPLYKPSLTDFEKAIADIEDRVQHIEYAAARFILEEQRQSNCFKVEKRNEKKTTLIRHLLHSDEDFDEDDLADAVPLMVKFVSTHALDQLLDLCVDLCEKHRKQILISKFVRSICSEEIFYSTDSEGSDKEYDPMSHDSDESSLNSWTDLSERHPYELTDYLNYEFPRKLRSLDSIKEEREPSETDSIYTTTDDPDATPFW